MTLLQYILTGYLGRPAGTGKAPGVSYWPCPRCGKDHFRTLPAHPRYKHRAKCHGCGLLEDAAGIVRLFCPSADYSARVEILEFVTEEWLETQATHSLSRAEG